VASWRERRARETKPKLQPTIQNQGPPWPCAFYSVLRVHCSESEYKSVYCFCVFICRVFGSNHKQSVTIKQSTSSYKYKTSGTLLPVFGKGFFLTISTLSLSLKTHSPRDLSLKTDIVTIKLLQKPNFATHHCLIFIFFFFPSLSLSKNIIKTALVPSSPPLLFYFPTSLF
jgi:hypothetical protein